MKKTNHNYTPRQLLMQAMRFSDLAYDNMIHQYFVTWCERIAAKFHRPHRELIADEKIFAYYQRQWTNLVENRMMIEYGRYLAKGFTGAELTYLKCIWDFATELQNYYPASLLGEPQKQKPKYNFNNN